MRCAKTGDHKGRPYGFVGNTNRAWAPGRSNRLRSVSEPPWFSAMWRLSVRADAGTVRLGGEERHEQVFRVRKARPFVLDEDLHRLVVLRPAHGNTAMGFEGGVDSVRHEVDQRLLQLVPVCMQRDFRSSSHVDGEPTFQCDHIVDTGTDIDLTESGAAATAPIAHRPP